MKKTTLLILSVSTLFLPSIGICAGQDAYGSLLPEMWALPNGKVISMNTSSRNFLMHTSSTRFNPDGSLDNSFNSTGKLFVGEAKDWIVQPDGQILFLFFQAPQTMLIARFRADGKIDSRFGSGGVAKISAEKPLNLAGNPFLALRAFSDERLLVAFEYSDGNGYRYARFFRLLKTGEIDKTFGNQGSVMTEGGSISGVFVQKNNAIVSLRTKDGYFYIEQLDSNGNPDAGFGQSGKAFLDKNLRPVYFVTNYFFGSKEGASIVATEGYQAYRRGASCSVYP